MFFRSYSVKCDVCNEGEFFEEAEAATKTAVIQSLRRVGWSFGARDLCPACNGRKVWIDAARAEEVANEVPAQPTTGPMPCVQSGCACVLSHASDLCQECGHDQIPF